MPVTGQIGMHASIVQSAQTAQDLASGTAQLPYFKNWDITSGVAANQADQLYQKIRTVTSGANDDVDLSGALTNFFGASVAFVKVKAIIIEASAANTTNLTVGNATSSGFQGPFGALTHTLVLKPGDFVMLAAPNTGWNVTATSADLLRVANAAGASATYNLILLGTTS